MREKAISSFDDTKVCYVVSGNIKGNPVVFLHGITGNRTSWAYQAEFLEKKKIPFIIIELRGHGKSQARLFKGFIEDSIRDISFILKKERVKKALFVGHCTGAMISYKFYSAYEDKVSKLVLVNPSHKITRIGVLFSSIPYVTLFSILLKPFMKKRVVDKTKYSRNKLYFNATSSTSFKAMVSADIDNILFSYKRNFVRPDNNLLLITADNDILFSLSSQKRFSKTLGAKLKVVRQSDHEMLRQKSKEINTIIYNFIRSKNGKTN